MDDRPFRPAAATATTGTPGGTVTRVSGLAGDLLHKHSLVVGRNCSDWIVKDNIFRHNTREPLVCHAEAGMLVKDNLIQ